MANQCKKIKISKIISCILDILLIVISIFIILGVYYIAQIKVLKSDYANIFGYTFFEVATGSMSKAIEVGDVVIVKITKEVNENDIIVYKDDKNFITHRLIKKDGETLIAKGDANNSEDKPITNEQILGQVICIIPKLGIWKKIILSPEILGLIAALIILIWIVLSVTNKTDKKTEEKKDE